MSSLATGPVRLAIDETVAKLTLHRPERRNALDVGVLAGLEEAVTRLHRHPEVRVTVLTAEGPSFCAGADLKERGQPMARAERRVVAERWQDLFDSFERLPHPTIAAIQGAAIGGGLLLALVCDLRLAASDLVVRLPEVALGVPVSGAGIPRLAREIGLARARDLVLTGRSLDARQAYEWGLVTRVVKPHELATATDELLAQMLVGPPDGLRVATRALHTLGRTLGSIELAWPDAELASYRDDG